MKFLMQFESVNKPITKGGVFEYMNFKDEAEAQLFCLTNTNLFQVWKVLQLVGI